MLPLHINKHFYQTYLPACSDKADGPRPIRTVGVSVRWGFTPTTIARKLRKADKLKPIRTNESVLAGLPTLEGYGPSGLKILIGSSLTCHP